LNYQLPINLGIIEFDNDNDGINFSDNLYKGLIDNPTLQKKFNIYPYSILIANQNLLRIRNLKDLNDQMFKSLRSNLSIEFLITGRITDNAQISFRLIRTADGKYFFNQVFNENRKEEVINKIIQLLVTGKESNSPHPEMVLVEGGIFTMGYLGHIDSASGIDLDEIPAHEVSIRTFYIDKYEVTVREYKDFCTDSKRAMPSPPKGGWQDNHPIVNITWEDAKAYAEWNGKRLPTEAEWEYASRGGNKSKGYDYSGSNNFNEIAWFYPNSKNSTHPIGMKTANELGIYDMSGNVWEWCETDYKLYAQAEIKDQDNYKSSKIIRGGSFRDNLKNLRSSNRSRFYPLSKADDIGFRCVKDVDK
jgi:formylglycine-generating enzyme